MAWGGGKGSEGRGVPDHAEAVNVEETVASCDLGFGGGFGVDGGIVGEEFGQIMLVDLLAQGMSRGWMGFIHC